MTPQDAMLIIAVLLLVAAWMLLLRDRLVWAVALVIIAASVFAAILKTVG